MSGVNWMRRNERLEDPRDRADEQRLGQPRHADEQDVPAGEQAGEQLLDHVVLADDHLADLAAEPPVSLGQGADGCGVVGSSLRCFCRRHADSSSFRRTRPSRAK